MRDVQVFGDRLHVVAAVAPGEEDLRRQLEGSGATLHTVRVIPPAMEDVFMHLQRSEVGIQESE